jgi:hypothetical protein
VIPFSFSFSFISSSPLSFRATTTTLSATDIDDMGFGDQPQGQPDQINGIRQLRQISSLVVNGDEEKVPTLYQKDMHKGIILSLLLLLPLKGREEHNHGRRIME